MKKIFLLLVLITASFLAHAQFPGWDWAHSAGGAQSDEGRAVAADAAGNTYVTGRFTAPSITFGSTTLVCSGSQDIYLVKYDPSGNVVWAVGAGGTDIEIGSAVTVDLNGDVYITGNFLSPSITFGTTTLVGQMSSNTFFIAKYSSGGIPIWAAAGSGASVGRGVSTDAVGNVYVTGEFFQSTFSVGSITLTNSGLNTSDLFLAKYSSSGTPLWATSASGTNMERSYTVCTDPAGDVYMAGNFMSPQLSFGTTILMNAGTNSNDIYLAKYDSNGTFLWAVNVGGTGSDAIGKIAANSEGVYVSGAFSGPSASFGSTVLTSAGSYDAFLAKYSPSSALLWVNGAGGNGLDGAVSVAVDTSGNVFTIGVFESGTLSFGSTVLTNAGTNNTSDIFVTKYTSSGAVAWAVGAGGTGDDDPASIAADLNGELYVTGIFRSPSLVFGSSTLVNAGSNTDDIFLAKIGPGCTVAPGQPSAIAGANPVCAGSSQSYSVPPVIGATSYTWTLPTGWVGSGTINSISVVAGTNGGNITVTAVNSCGSSPVTTMAVTVTPSPNPTVTQAGASLSTASGQGTYQWYFNGSPIAGATGNTFTATQNGSYYVIVTNNGCNGQSNAITVTGLKVKGPKKKGLEAYPTINSGRFLIKLSDNEKPLAVRVINLQGQIIKAEIHSPEASILDVQLTDRIPGIYIIELLYADSICYEKIVVE